MNCPAFFIAYTACYGLVFVSGGLAHMRGGSASSAVGATTQSKKLAHNVQFVYERLGRLKM